MNKATQSLARERIENLLDDNSFIEIGAYVTARATDFVSNDIEALSDGVITGYGTICRKLVYIYSQDISVLGGTLGEMNSKKIVSLYELAMKTGAPIIAFLDSAGMRLEEAVDALNGFGGIYKQQVLASGIIPQISAVFGTCAGGMAVSLGLSDFVFMEEENAKIYVNSPNTFTGNYIDKLDTRTSDFQEKETSLITGTGTELEVIDKVKTIISLIPANNEDDMSDIDCIDDLNRLNNIEDIKHDVKAVIKDISDSGMFFELKSEYAKEMVTAFIKLNGITVGVAANVRIEDKIPVLTSGACEKATDFVKFCDAFNIPILTISDVEGFETTLENEKNIAVLSAKLVYALSSSTVPKVNLITNVAYSSASLIMNNKSIGADMVFAWKDAKVGLMESELAVKIIYAKEIASSNNAAEYIKTKAKEYSNLQNSVMSFARRGYIDDIIEESKTRKCLIAAFEMLYTKREDRPYKKHGTR
jgi:Acetyl-CoA carboxylase, carboxyltransferase component (subunits alpha and beta)